VVSLVVFTAPPRQSAARWQPAPSSSMQVAQSPDVMALSVAPRSLRPKPARLLAAEEVVVHPVVVAARDKPEAARPRSSRLRQPVSPRASVTRVRQGSPPPPQSTPPVQRPEQGDRRPWLTASLPLSSGVTDAVRPAASAAADAPTSGPVNVAEALMSIQQDAASSQMQDELLLMAQEVARVSGELPSTPISAESAGT
jgi:hypothetical protein